MDGDALAGDPVLQVVQLFWIRIFLQNDNHVRGSLVLLLYGMKGRLCTKKTAGGFSLAVWDSLVHGPDGIRRRLSKKTFLRRKAIGRAFKVKSTVIILACKPESIHGVSYLRYVYWAEPSPPLKKHF